jgi:hypothetical protein
MVMAFVTLAGWLAVGGLSESFPREARFGVFAAGCAVVSTVLLLAYWWRVQWTQGFKARPRVSFREIFVLYFGLSIEVGLIVDTLKSSNYQAADHVVGLAAMFLPPALIVAIALIDDVPACIRIKPRIRHQRQNLQNPPQTLGPQAHATTAVE